jgi:hypothetical protein
VRLQPILLSLLGGALFVGCGVRDPGWILNVRNESATTLLVAVDDGHRRVLFVPSGATGNAYLGLGAFRREIVVLETDCSVRAIVDAPEEGSFLLTIDASGGAALESREMSTDIDSLRQLAGVCGGDVGCERAAPPWPSGIPGLGPEVVWCLEDR